MKKNSRWICFLLLVLLTSCSGEQNQTPPTYKVVGKVTYQGKPVSEATLIFKKLDQSRGAVGETDSDGQFRLTTYSLDDGAPSGDYQVAIMCYEKPKLNASEAEMFHLKNKLPAKFEDPKKSGLTAKVAENDQNVVNFELK
jgi:hypothetical protein